MLRGIFPILLVPFDSHGQIDEKSLRRLINFEIDGQAQGLGVGGFASEAYKLSERERIRCAEIVADEVNGRVPLIIGIAPSGTEIAIEQAHIYAEFNPAALMTLPPATMFYGDDALVEHYVTLGNVARCLIMVQQSPHIPGFKSGTLSVESLAKIAEQSPNVQYFKIEGTGSVERVKTLRQLVRDKVSIFGGVGGLAVHDEWQAGAAGLLPGCGFNEYFVEAWQLWEKGYHPPVQHMLRTIQPLVEAVSSHGHEFSLHARKYLLKRAGIIDTTYVRKPTTPIIDKELEVIAQLADSLNLRISHR
jgi:dihydrodipicolinate synthase/N-acetylneuraminate lyase